MKLKEIHNVYFVGIGGIGMSAIARYFLASGKSVYGYDKTPSPITEQLAAIGALVHFDDNLDYVKSLNFQQKDTLVVYTPAIPDAHQELNYFISDGFEVLKRAEVLGKITSDTFCLAVAGTHGKTTTSSILGHIMKSKEATAFLGGIAENYNSNLILGATEVSVVEADEFDRSFLHLSPNIACVTSMDADHLDIYGSHQELIHSFNEFSAKVSDTLVVAKGLPLQGLTYAIEEDADYVAENFEIKNGVYVFDIQTPSGKINAVEFQLPGRHNIMNALAAVAMADIYGVSHQVIKERLQGFKGVKRRFSYQLKTSQKILIDDYAHHPTEIKAVCNSVREMYPDQKVLAVFQPHLYTRTQDFADDFAAELSKFDELLLLPIYPARELPIKGVSSQWLLGKLSLSKAEITSKENLVFDVLKSDAKVVVMIGAGDIGLLVEVVKKEIINKYNLTIEQ